MDFERATVLLNVIHMSIGVEQANGLRAAAMKELYEICNPVPAQGPAMIPTPLDLSGKPVDEEDSNDHE